MKTVLVFGASGFSGRHFQQLVQAKNLVKEYKFVGTTRRAGTENKLWQWETADLTKPSIVEDIIQKHLPSYVVNLAGNLVPGSLQEQIEIATTTSQRILRMCANQVSPVEGVLLIGSAAEYGLPECLPLSETQILKPLNANGLSKVLQTEIAQYFWRARGVPVCVARTFNIVGKDMPRSLSLGSFIDQIRSSASNGAIKVGNLDSRRDLIHIDDAVEAYWDILMRGRRGEAYNVCSGFSINMGELLETLVVLSGKNLKIIKEEGRLRSHDIQDIYGSFEKLTKDTGWRPTRNILEEVEEWASFLETKT